MLDLSSEAVLIIDHGYFIWLAQRLARDFGQVYYYRYGWEDAQAKINKRIVGDGFENIQSVAEPYKLLDQGLVKRVIFPDVYHAEFQEHIERMGIPVWGARHGDILETGKLYWKSMQKALGIECAEYDVIEGIEDLRDYCKRETDRVIKMTPQYRGNRETFIHHDYASSRGIIDDMAAEFEALQDVIRFIAEKKIKSKIEGGIDTYTVDGKHPGMVVYGFEKKDKCYFATVKPYNEIPEEIRGVSDKLWPVLKEFRVKQFISSEVMVTDAKESHLIDNTTRLPSPAGEEQGELYKNLAEIFYEGATGTLVEPVIEKRFACEAMVEHTGDSERFRSLEVPEHEAPWIKLYNCFQVKGKYGTRIGIAPMDHDIIGAVVGIGDTPQEALDHLHENAACLKDQPVIVHTDALASVLMEIEESEEKGMAFTQARMPEPASALES